MKSLFDTGIRPTVDKWLLDKAAEKRDYGKYWSASSAGYCMRRVIFERLQVPYVTEDARKQRVFTSGHLFHDWLQSITKEAGISIAQELELQDEDLMIRGHIDDLVLIRDFWAESTEKLTGHRPKATNDHLILYDYKSAHSKWFEYKRTDGISYYHKMQLGTYMYMLRKSPPKNVPELAFDLLKTDVLEATEDLIKQLTEARILHISKDDLRMAETLLLWSDELEKEVVNYWEQLNAAWKAYNDTGKLPNCTCADHENGFLAKEAYNGYFYNGQPCSIEYFNEWEKKK